MNSGLNITEEMITEVEDIAMESPKMKHRKKKSEKKMNNASIIYRIN